MVGFWLFLIFFGLLAWLALISSSGFLDDPNATLFDVFALDQYQWYRSLKGDVQVAWRQMVRDWKRFCRFFDENAWWVFASAMGMIGLFLTALLMIGFIPLSVKSAFAETLNSKRTLLNISHSEMLETRTTLPDPVYAAFDPSVYMEVDGFVPPSFQPQRFVSPAAVEEIKVKEPVRHLRIFERFGPPNVQQLPNDDQEIEVVGLPMPSGMTPEMNVLANETLSGEIRRQDNRVAIQISGLSIEKIYPESVTPGDSVLYEVLLRNTGETVIDRIRIEEAIPALSRIISSVPKHEPPDDAGRYIWIVDHLEPDEEQSIRIELDADRMDFVRTKTRVVVSVYSESPDSVVQKKEKPRQPARKVPQPKPTPEVVQPEVIRSRKKPTPKPVPDPDTIGRLRLEVSGPKRVRVGDEVVYDLKLTNRGDESIDNARILIGLDQLIESAKGKKIIKLYVEPELKPGETRSTRFRGMAVRAGSAATKVQVVFGRKVMTSGIRRLEILTADESPSPSPSP